MLLETEMLAYVAGIIDGEGCVGIHRGFVWPRRGPKKYEHYMLRVEVASTSRELIDFMLSTFGGQFYAGKRPNRKPYYRWVLAAKSGEEFLRRIYPYLIIKKGQVDLIFKFRQSTGISGTKLTPEVVAFRRHCYEQLALMKKEI
jgi:hypothetical protein